MELALHFNVVVRLQITKHISGSAGPIFAIFSPNESILGAELQMIDLDLFFSISQGTLPWQPIL